MPTKIIERLQWPPERPWTLTWLRRSDEAGYASGIELSVDNDVAQI
jgi:hypothetical protein